MDDLCQSEYSPNVLVKVSSEFGNFNMSRFKIIRYFFTNRIITAPFPRFERVAFLRNISLAILEF